MTVASRHSVAERLRAAREKAGFRSAADAARHLGLKPATVRAHESGQNGVSAQMAAEYAGTYGVPLGWLLSGEDETTPSAPPSRRSSLTPSARELLASNKGAETMLEALSYATVGTLAGILAIGTTNIYRNLQIALDPLLTFNSDFDRSAFWIAAKAAPESIILMGLGAGRLTQSEAESLRLLSKLGVQVVAATSLEELDESMAFKAGIREFLAPRYSSIFDEPAVVKQALALETATMAVKVLEGGGVAESLDVLEQVMLQARDADSG